MSTKLFKLKVTLCACHVKIWRKVVVPANIKLNELHNIIQDVMGWHNAHLHEFIILGMHYGVPHPEDWEEVLPEKKFRLNQLVKLGWDQFEYVYDFGDDWRHTIKVESFDYKDDSGKTIFCLNGKGTCPPEDVGSSYGYDDFCDAINDKSHPEHNEMREWVHGFCGYPEDTAWPDGFEIDRINARLAVHEKKVKSAPAKKKSSPSNTDKTARHYEIATLLNGFADKHLDKELKSFCIELLDRLARKRAVSILSGKREIWAAAIVCVIARLNFLYDKSNPCYITKKDICEFFGTKPTTIGSKASAIEKACKIGMVAEGLCKSNIVDSLSFYELPNGFVVSRDVAKELGYC